MKSTAVSDGDVRVIMTNSHHSAFNLACLFRSDAIMKPDSDANKVASLDLQMVNGFCFYGFIFIFSYVCSRSP